MSETRISVNIVEIELSMTLLWFIMMPVASGCTAYEAIWEIPVLRKTK